jgi:hypothetical protein
MESQGYVTLKTGEAISDQNDHGVLWGDRDRSPRYIATAYMAVRRGTLIDDERDISPQFISAIYLRNISPQYITAIYAYAIYRHSIYGGVEGHVD